MKLNDREKEFIYQILDQTIVRGLEQKQLLLAIMVKLAEEMQKDTKENDD